MVRSRPDRTIYTGVAQLVEHWSPKPGVGSSSLSSRAKKNSTMNIKGYFKESYTELVHKVTWPTWSELQNSAVLVMVASLIFALLVAGMDFTFSRVMEFIYSLLY
jgi:preprotein translocase subunit SecE